MQIQVVTYRLGFLGRLRAFFTGKVYLLATSDGQQTAFDVVTSVPVPTAYTIPLAQNQMTTTPDGTAEQAINGSMSETNQ